MLTKVRFILVISTLVFLVGFVLVSRNYYLHTQQLIQSLQIRLSDKEDQITAIQREQQKAMENVPRRSFTPPLGVGYGSFTSYNQAELAWYKYFHETTQNKSNILSYVFGFRLHPPEKYWRCNDVYQDLNLTIDCYQMYGTFYKNQFQDDPDKRPIPPYALQKYTIQLSIVDQNKIEMQKALRKTKRRGTTYTVEHPTPTTYAFTWFSPTRLESFATSSSANVYGQYVLTMETTSDLLTEESYLTFGEKVIDGMEYLRSPQIKYPSKEMVMY